MNYIKTTIGEHCTVTSSKRIHLSERSGEGVPFYCSKEIIQMVNGEEVTECDYIREDLYEQIKREYGVPQDGDLLMTTRGTYGIPYIYAPEDRFYFADGNLTWLKDFDSLLMPEYLYYWILSHEGQSKIDAIAKGTAQKAVPIALIKALELNLPSNEVQKQVVQILSAYDSLLDNCRKQIKLLEEAARRLYREWFVDLRFPGHEHVQIADGVPEGWNILRLCDVASITMGQSPKSEYFNEDKIGLPFHQGVGSYGVRFVQDKIYSTSATRIAEARSILFSVRAPVGRLNITKERIVIGRGLAAICHKMGLQSFLYYMLKDKFFKEDIIGNGSIFASISKEELHQQKLLIPNDELCEKFDALASMIDKKIENLDSQVRLATEARDRLLPRLMSGEIEL